jgi:restriction system protein
MGLWLVRSGRYGEHEQRFLSENRLFLTWQGLNENLSKVGDKRNLLALLQRRYPTFSAAKLRNHAAQLWSFVNRMKPGDVVVVPSKVKPAIHIGELVGGYEFAATAPDPYFHSRKVKWLKKDLPRSVFSQDLLYSFGAIMTICEVKRNDAEERVRAIAYGKDPSERSSPAEAEVTDSEPDSGEIADLEEFARDQIAKHIVQRFKGHALERLVEAILRAQGYTTYHSPTGPDKGIDLLAAPGPLGFGSPRICVQVKSGDSPTDSATLNQLIGAMQNVHAEQGLLVSWGGFRSSVDKEVPTQFFRVRLWDQHELIRQLMEHYDRLDEDFRAELPLKRIWALSVAEESEE